MSYHLRRFLIDFDKISEIQALGIMFRCINKILAKKHITPLRTCKCDNIKFEAFITFNYLSIHVSIYLSIYL